MHISKQRLRWMRPGRPKTERSRVTFADSSIDILRCAPRPKFLPRTMPGIWLRREQSSSRQPSTLHRVIADGGGSCVMVSSGNGRTWAGCR